MNNTGACNNPKAEEKQSCEVKQKGFLSISKESAIERAIRA